MYPALTLPLRRPRSGPPSVSSRCWSFARPVLRRLALRQVARRPSESVLVVLGVRARHGPDRREPGRRRLARPVGAPDGVRGAGTDRRVRARPPSGPRAPTAERRLAVLRRTPASTACSPSAGTRPRPSRTDGTAPAGRAAGAGLGARLRRRRPVRPPDPSGLDVADPGRAGVVLNRHLADSLERRGGRPGHAPRVRAAARLTVRAVVPAERAGRHGCRREHQPRRLRVAGHPDGGGRGRRPSRCHDDR